jgi:hypothetical protein
MTVTPVTPPVLSGNAQQGQVLTTSNGTWTFDLDYLTYSYEWERCDVNGDNCVAISGQSGQTLLLTSADVGHMIRARVDAVEHSNVGGAWPAAFLTGPAGANNILPPQIGCFIGAASAAPSSTTNPNLSVLESLCGRTLDLEHRYWQDGYIDWNEVAAIVARGHIPYISFLPTPRNGGRILNGEADAQLISIGQQIAAQPNEILLRIYWEFNGNWYDFSKNTSGGMLTTAQFWSMWKRTVDKLNQGGAFSKASIVWCPHQGYYGRPDPGWVDAHALITEPDFDDYVDWVGADDYNFWQSNGWMEFSRLFDFADNPSVARDFEGRKPFLVGETSSTEYPGDPNRKANWWRNIATYVKGNMPNVTGVAAFDINYTDGDWRILSSTASGQGFRELARDPYFNPRNMPLS